VRGPLRAGLAVMAIGALCNSGYSVSKLVAVAARWSGHDWAVLGTNVSPAAAGMGALITVVGVLIPLVGPRLTEWVRSWRTYVRLAPLERELDDLLSHRSLRLPRPRLASPTTWLVWRQTSIHNALGYLDACLDRALYARTREAALRATGDAERAEATAWAAVIASAAWDTAEWQHTPPCPHRRGPLVERAPDPAALVRIADALATSELVAAARTHGGTTRTGAA
jgi:hypothetical protein